MPRPWCSSGGVTSWARSRPTGGILRPDWVRQAERCGRTRCQAAGDPEGRGQAGRHRRRASPWASCARRRACTARRPGSYAEAFTADPDRANSLGNTTIATTPPAPPPWPAAAGRRTTRRRTTRRRPALRAQALGWLKADHALRAARARGRHRQDPRRSSRGS